MGRRVLCLGAALLVLSIPACDSGNKAKKQETKPDPDAGAKPNPAGGARGG